MALIVEIKVPSPGESITEAELHQWFVTDGDLVLKDQELGEIESDKATLPLLAPESGKITIRTAAGSTVKIGEIVASIDTSAKMPTTKSSHKPLHQPTPPTEKIHLQQVVSEPKNIAPTHTEISNERKVKVTPLAREIMAANGLSVEDIINGLRKLGREEVEKVINAGIPSVIPEKPTNARVEKKEKLSQLRKKLSQRLVSVKNETAMLTTFNEVDMSAVMQLRERYKQAFTEKYGVKPGLMSFFTRAAAIALREFPKVNSQLDGEEMLSFDYADISIAVQTDKGLMVPVIRNAESKSLAEIESELARLAKKARENRLGLEEMAGGTFTITNGGVFGSLMSTPILNPPQSAILGMHNIVDRPVAINGRVEIRPMMYLALSYDHRIIDGRDSVSFLVRIKHLIEHPVDMLFPGTDSEKTLMGL